MADFDFDFLVKLQNMRLILFPLLLPVFEINSLLLYETSMHIRE